MARAENKIVCAIHLLIEGPDNLCVEVAPVVCLLPSLDLGHDWTSQSDLGKIGMETFRKKHLIIQVLPEFWELNE